MAWIESHTVLLRHRKVLQLASDLAIPPVYVMGHLHALWHSVLEQQENGDLTDWSDVMIAQASAYSSEPKVSSDFVAALRTRKWLDGNIVHDWIEHAGLFLIKKYSTSNPSKLRYIWKLHGYKYGKRDSKSLHRLANRKRTDSEPKANLPNQPNLTRPNQPNLTEECVPTFEEFWMRYPRKDGKSRAEKVWDKLRPSHELFRVMSDALSRHARSDQWTRDGGNFIPHASSWLNQQRWNDEGVMVTARPKPKNMVEYLAQAFPETKVCGGAI